MLRGMTTRSHWRAFRFTGACALVIGLAATSLVATTVASASMRPAVVGTRSLRLLQGRSLHLPQGHFPLGQFVAFARRASAVGEGFGNLGDPALKGHLRSRLSRPRPAEPRVPQAATTFTVNSTADDPSSSPTSTTCLATNGKCTLRAAVAAADNLGKTVNIKLSSSDYVLDDTAVGTMVVSDPGAVTIEGTSPTKTIISVLFGDDIEPFAVEENSQDEGGVLFLASLSIEGGSAVSPSTDGGALTVDAGCDAVVTDVNLESNVASDEGGAIASFGNLWVSDSTIKDNTATEDGGGIFAVEGSAEIARSTITGNTADSGGGGLAIASPATIIDTSVSSNTAGTTSTAGVGGGILAEGVSLSLSGTTVNFNRVADDGEGGGIFADGAGLVMQGGQLSHNSAIGGAGGAAALLETVVAAFTKVVVNANTGSLGGILALSGDELPTALDITGGSLSGNTSEAVVALAPATGASVELDISGAVLDDNGTSSSAVLPCAAAVCAATLAAGATFKLILADDTIDKNSVQPVTEIAGAVEAVAAEGGSGSVDLQGDTVDDDSAPGAALSTGAVLLSSVSDRSTPVYSPLLVDITGATFERDSVGVGGDGGAIGVASSTTSGDTDSASVTMSDDTFANDTAGVPSGTTETYGGAVSIAPETLGSITDSTFRDNAAKGADSAGGAILDEDEAAFTYADDTFTSNTAHEAGGALALLSEAATIEQCTFSNNRAEEGGGLLLAESEFSISGSTFSGNSTPVADGMGGALVLADVRGTVSNSTITGNLAGASGEGGGILVAGIVTLDSDTITANVAGTGSALYTTEEGQSVTLEDSILSHNTTKAKGGGENDCGLSTSSGEVAIAAASEGGNVLGSAKCVVELAAGDKVSTNPKLHPLASNGGPTETMALEASSPARKIGLACLPTDQRGRPRPVTNCDAGAYELPKA
ncbi:MAG TPA: right-handed parallel beta-helix repeat-containing protein [Acidimicrobiales bacterium]|nr:right-handed parallel beta-helix repeat-containing protein [Acidimicrobiales bacterium]